MVPFTSFAKSAITESDLAAITAQEGVTIDFSNFTVGGISINVQSWGDGDGFGAYTTAGWVGATDINLASDFITITGEMTIDVGTSGAVTALGIGLPGLNFSGDMYQTIRLADSAANLATSTQILGTAYMSGLSVSPTGSLIIRAH
jgi:hypothetical protein